MLTSVRRALLEGSYRASVRLSVVAVMCVVFVLHVLFSRLVDLPDAGGRYEWLLGVAYFVFGLFAAFAIENARSGLMRVNELLKSGDADLISLHELSMVFGPESNALIREEIDCHLQDQIDYRLPDFVMSMPSFVGMFRQVRSLEPSSNSEQVAYDHMLGVCVAAAERRKLLEALLRQRISPVEWTTLLGLFASLWVLMFAASGGPWLVSLIGGVLVASVAGTLVLLRQLDHHRWQERDSIWSPLHTLFETLDLLPYYPRVVITHRRVDPPSGPIRVVDYPHPYPDMSDKEVHVIDHVHRGK